jgi:hypothetical protein
MLFDGDGNRMTPSHAGKKSTHYCGGSGFLDSGIS